MLMGAETAAARRRLRRRGPDLAARPRPAEDPGTDGLPQIDHIVILMMENHSYDNYLGMLAGRGDGFTLGPDGKPAETNPSENGTPAGLRHLDSTVQVKRVPTQSWAASHLQYASGACDGFVTSLGILDPGLDQTAAMGYWTKRELPFYYDLARTFPLATRWFCSCLGPTFPNRRFLIAGTANGLIDDLPFGMTDYPARGTIFDLLTAHKITWTNYHLISPVRIGWRRLSHARGLGFLRPLGGVIAALVPGTAGRMLAKLQVTADLYPLGLLRSVNHVKPVKHFLQRAGAGTLPSVSIVDPDFSHCSEENPQDIQAGESFAAEIINAVMSGPGWPKTLLIWLYDEHGGYYDHVPPPGAAEPDDVRAVGSFDRFWILRQFARTSLGRRVTRDDDGPDTYARLGFRVPAVIVSPYAKQDYVSDQVFDHTSVLKLIEHKWNLPPLTRRDAEAAAPLDLLDLAGEPSYLDPPELARPARPGFWRYWEPPGA
ncbi:MAG TPA: alkaline phosphatase family protein [Streptosporangiaceae bacterium]|nr:alkaline phosphatase family protein [Streptosporangiaceae bacterium]